MTDKKLDSYLVAYTPFNDWLINRRYKYLQDFFVGANCLEMGIAEGAGVGNLLKKFEKVTVVDGSKDAIKSIKERYPTPNLTAVNSYFEDMDLGDTRFDTILMAHILEHVDDPIVVLKQAMKFLTPNGVMVVDVPNGNSLHRQIGVKLGMISKTTDLNDADISIGHQRVYTPDTFKRDIEAAGLKIKQYGGMFIKTLSNSQMEKVYNEGQLEALFTIGEDNPDISAEIYVITTPK